MGSFGRHANMLVERTGQLVIRRIVQLATICTFRRHNVAYVAWVVSCGKSTVDATHSFQLPHVATVTSRLKGFHVHCRFIGGKKYNSKFMSDNDNYLEIVDVVRQLENYIKRCVVEFWRHKMKPVTMFGC